MNFCRSGEVFFMQPERVLRDGIGVHYGEAPRAAASFNRTRQLTPGARRRYIRTPLARRSCADRWAK